VEQDEKRSCECNALISAIGGIWSFELPGTSEKAKLLIEKTSALFQKPRNSYPGWVPGWRVINFSLP
jgi:hypothetical protein